MEAIKNNNLSNQTSAIDRVINITVKAKGLFKHAPTKSQEKIDQYVKIKNEGGQESGYGQEKKNFNTNVFMKHNVTWKIASKDPDGKDSGYKVSFKNIENIKHNYFDRAELKPVDADMNTIVGTVSKDPVPGKHDTYTITFKIENTQAKDSKSFEFSIDPKLSIEKSTN